MLLTKPLSTISGEFFSLSKKLNGLISCQHSINTEISRELLDTGHFEVMTVEADEDEHSIEMQLPYIAKVANYANLCLTMKCVFTGDGVCQREVQHCPSDGEKQNVMSTTSTLDCWCRWAASPPAVKPSMARFLPSILR